MSETIRRERRAVAPSGSTSTSFTARVAIEHGSRVVHLAGELGREHRELVARSCLGGGDAATVRIEMAALSFMDCGGYGGLVAAQRVLEQGGGSLCFANASGEPRRLLLLIDELESTREPSCPADGTGLAAPAPDPWEQDGGPAAAGDAAAPPRRSVSGAEPGAGEPGPWLRSTVHIGPVSHLGATRFCWRCGGVSRSVPCAFPIRRLRPA